MSVPVKFEITLPESTSAEVCLITALIQVIERYEPQMQGQILIDTLEYVVEIANATYN